MNLSNLSSRLVAGLTLAQLLFFTAITFAQTSNDILNGAAAPSANAVSSINKGGYNVDLYTGRLAYHADINGFTVSKINIPLGLMFASSGIKVKDVDGPAGIGWRLNAGGIISRVVRSLPDEAFYGYCGPNRTGGANASNFANPGSQWLTNIMNNINTQTTWDSEPDQFFFSFLNYYGVFTLDPDGNPVLQSSYGLKVVYSPFNRTNGRMSGGNEDWILQDNDGNKYYFGDQAVENSSVTSHGLNANNTFTNNFISSWYLSKIVTYDNQLISFGYQTFPSQTYTTYFNIIMGYQSGSGENYRPYNENTDITVSAPIYLSSITSSVYQINLRYSQTTATPYLLEVDASQNNILEYKYHINYITINYPTYKRFEVANISQLSPSTADSITLYRFTYSNTLLPDRNAVQSDYWGYTNLNTGTTDVPGSPISGACSRAPNFLATNANILQTVTNAFGGQIVFTYELRDFAKNNLTTSGGGIRIKNISNTVNGLTTVTQYTYNDPATGISSGQEYNDPTNLHTGSPPSEYWTAQHPSGIADAADVEIGYSWVSVTQPDGGATRYHFTNFSDYPDVGRELVTNSSGHGEIDPTTDAYTFNFPLTSKAFARGKMLSQELIDAHNNVIQKSTYNYMLSTPFGDVIWLKGYTRGFDNEGIHRADFSSQDLLLSSLTTTNNFYNSSYALINSYSTTENYTYTSYNGNNFIASKKKTLSDGSVKTTTFRYPFNILTSIPTAPTAGMPMSFLVLNNIINKPVETVESVLSSATGNEIVTSVQLNRYSGIFSGIVKPSSSYRLKTQSLLKGAYVPYSVTPGASSETETIDNANLEQVVVYYQYDGAGNIIELKNPYTNDGQTAFIWGYGSNFLIAKATNAHSNEIYYQSFEEGVFSNLATGGAHSGSHYISASTYLVGVPNPGSKSYVISYWYLSGGVWKYSGLIPYTGSMTLSNGTGYDDICIFPTDALLTTYTYEPLVGVTSSEDNKGQTTSYEYDEFKRLLNVRDMNNNILKNYSYYIQGQ
ncbi:MAG: hypothetical protein ACXVJD_15260 [Mucilaginibacter sp.]